MKYFVSFFLVFSTTAFGEEPAPAPLTPTQYHVFTCTNGTAIRARPIDFFATRGDVRLLTDDDEKLTVKIDALSEKDQTYINNWNVAFMLLDRIRITPKKVIEKLERTTKKLSCRFQIENRTKEDIEDLRIEYCIYIEVEFESSTQAGRMDPYTVDNSRAGMSMSGGFISQGRVNKYPARTRIDKINGTFLVDQLPRREELVKKTTTQYLYNNREKESFSNGIMTRKKETSRHLGIRYRMYLPTQNEKDTMVEFVDLKKLIQETEWPADSPSS